jgi:hypothetical protein|nr:MAG TPA: hypothetical protein [Caudoviricetes sp.]
MQKIEVLVDGMIIQEYNRILQQAREVISNAIENNKDFPELVASHVNQNSLLHAVHAERLLFSIRDTLNFALSTNDNEALLRNAKLIVDQISLYEKNLVNRQNTQPTQNECNLGDKNE